MTPDRLIDLASSFSRPSSKTVRGLVFDGTIWLMATSLIWSIFVVLSGVRRGSGRSFGSCGLLVDLNRQSGGLLRVSEVNDQAAGNLVSESVEFRGLVRRK